jgi:hypothetical protein
VSAFSRESERHGTANAAGGAGDEGDTIFERA